MSMSMQAKETVMAKKTTTTRTESRTYKSYPMFGKPRTVTVKRTTR